MDQVWRPLPLSYPLPGVRDKVFQTTQLETIVSRADANRDGSVTQAELSNMIHSDGRYIDVDYDAAKVMLTNFRAIAYRALKEGEITTRDIRPTDNTIEVADVRKLAGFDGITTNFTKADVSLLANGNTSNWPQVGVIPPTPAPSNDKVFNTFDFESVMRHADRNYDGHLTKAELDLILSPISDIRYGNVDYNAARILQQNFAGIANRARKVGEPPIQTLVYDPTVNTIEVSELRKLAGFDGNAGNITKTDVSLLENGNTSNWPQAGGPAPVPTPAPVPSPAPVPTPAPTDPRLKQLIQLLLLLLLFGGGLFGRRN